MQIKVNCFGPYHLRYGAKANGNPFELRKRGTFDFTKRETGSSKLFPRMPKTTPLGRRFPVEQAWVVLVGLWPPGGLALSPQEPLDVPYQVLGVKNGAGGHALIVLALQLGDV